MGNKGFIQMTVPVILVALTFFMIKKKKKKKVPVIIKTVQSLSF